MLMYDHRNACKEIVELDNIRLKCFCKITIMLTISLNYKITKYNHFCFSLHTKLLETGHVIIDYFLFDKQLLTVSYLY